MKYLVNRQTKEHITYDITDFYDDLAWRVVEADDEGWIKWEGGECPVPLYKKVEVMHLSGDIYNCKAGKKYASSWAKNGFSSDIAAYRPILPAESKPEPENAWPDDGMPASVYIDVFKRFNAAVAASDSIPALIAEINAMLPEGYEVREKAKPEAVADDMSDCAEVNGFRVGDYVKCVSDRDASGLLEVGAIYMVRDIKNGELVFYENDCSWMTSRFKFHSRPEAK